MNRKFNLWLAVFLVILVGIVLWGRSAFIVCWDGMEIDEPLLLELCGITEDEYLSGSFDLASCPEADQAISMVGGCDTDWGLVMMTTAVFGGVYFLVSGIGFVVWRVVKKTKAE